MECEVRKTVDGKVLNERGACTMRALFGMNVICVGNNIQIV